MLGSLSSRSFQGRLGEPLQRYQWVCRSQTIWRILPVSNVIRSSQAKLATTFTWLVILANLNFGVIFARLAIRIKITIIVTWRSILGTIHIIVNIARWDLQINASGKNMKTNMLELNFPVEIVVKISIMKRNERFMKKRVGHDYSHVRLLVLHFNFMDIVTFYV